MPQGTKMTTLSHDDYGTGPALVLIHGFPLNRRMWQPQLKVLGDAGYRVIAPDLRGFGATPPGAGAWTMDALADDIVALLDTLKIERAVIGGMSMGGYVLLNLLERYPQRVAAALFLVTRGGGDDAAGKERRTVLAGEVEAGRPGVVTGAFAGLLFARATQSARPGLLAEVAAMMAETSLAGLSGGLRAIRDRRDYLDRLAVCTQPALVIGAQEDQAIPAEHGRILAAALPNAEFHLIAGGGHMVNMEQPEAFNRCLLDFLARLPR
ncbi:MAG: alpha/beta hydrolase [Desulfuromonadales bacterium GWD2_61_12]|nr:MAG: alpha/beta hydrolase [Desulfuromonadales bacterium GWC2_61_20]OGR33648.1 MAG: alpha/beta hydrolase [Desulfuromonadales bacterium GWD2_61_12]HAD05007.1 alpha/beta hydrolase [Desulfuromonas sp.]HBT83841.1 alpha/beta hydrolase [Desulfuromonas sp.]